LEIKACSGLNARQKLTKIVSSSRLSIGQFNHYNWVHFILSHKGEIYLHQRCAGVAIPHEEMKSLRQNDYL